MEGETNMKRGPPQKKYSEKLVQLWKALPFFCDREKVESSKDQRQRAKQQAQEPT